MELELDGRAEILHKRSKCAKTGISDSLGCVLNTSSGHLHSLIQVLLKALLACLSDESEQGVASLLAYGLVSTNSFSNNRLAAGQSCLLTEVSRKALN